MYNNKTKEKLISKAGTKQKEEIPKSQLAHLIKYVVDEAKHKFYIMSNLITDFKT